MLRWLLEPLDGGPTRTVQPTGTTLVGRTETCALQLTSDSVSRQHAELVAAQEGLWIKDLGSANGTLLNGFRITEARAVHNDLLTFGSVAFRVTGITRPDAPRIRTVDVHSGGGALARVQAERLAQLVDIARRLSGAIDTAAILETVVRQTAALLPADRVAILLLAPGGEDLSVAHSYHREGTAPVEVPRSISRVAIESLAPVVTENALEDARFQSGSVAASLIRAAVCVPLLADSERVLGVLYADSLTGTRPFAEDDAALCFAFGGLAAVSIAKAHFAMLARQEEIARVNFERFFAPAVAARIARQTSGARPGGERRTVTVLFSDVRGFTGMAESLAPELVASQLSEYFGAMVALVFEHGGTLDKFIGDALLAVWGAPTALADDSIRALAAARAMQRKGAELNAAWRLANRPELGIGIGIHRGEVFAGTIGSPQRLEYTVIGDVVNVTARLCKEAQAGEIVVSAAVEQELGERGTRTAEELVLRGREERVVVFRY